MQPLEAAIASASRAAFVAAFEPSEAGEDNG
jgi:hypothetical protein